jgi:hypothetical protein
MGRILDPVAGPNVVPVVVVVVVVAPLAESNGADMGDGFEWTVEAKSS